MSYLRCRVGDHMKPEQSVFWSPDELCWTHIILPRRTQTIQIPNTTVSGAPSLSLLLFYQSSPNFPDHTFSWHHPGKQVSIKVCHKTTKCTCVIYRIWRPSHHTQRLLSVLAADLHGNTRSTAELADHQRVFLDDALVDLQEFFGVSPVHRQLNHCRNAKSTVRDLRHYVTRNTYTK